MSYLTDLEAQRDAVAAALPAPGAAAAGGKPNVLGGGGSDVDHQGYVKGRLDLHDRLEAAYLRALEQEAAASGDVGIAESEEWPA